MNGMFTGVIVRCPNIWPYSVYPGMILYMIIVQIKPRFCSVDKGKFIVTVQFMDKHVSGVKDLMINKSYFSVDCILVNSRHL